ncbi:alkaline phosphatase D family protein [Alkalimarinus coralli]|uniref:alkaline phosphatase D family protein n=1 Tax=Alkalimarinus coralli TaxID=2935863 RepID=UPI00202B9248|nr:alkaline phosphatase D family protein [Alkalimarinus coralli]
MKLKVGPVLGFESGSIYTVCFSTDKSVQQAQLVLNNETISCLKVGETPSSSVWRAECSVSPTPHAQEFTYKVKLDNTTAKCQNNRDQWTFVYPGSSDTPNIAYTSCNGFSSMDLMHKSQAPFRLWDKMTKQHAHKPVSLILMGGDQLYADDIWSTIPELKKWNALNHKDKISRKATKTMCDQIDRFYDRIYQERWASESMSFMLASAPSVMMWDDHDIFDGWGSFPDKLQNCEVFQQIFKTAKKYFELFQIRSKHNKSLLDSDAQHYAFALKFNNYNILGLDNRTERTLNQVMGNDTQWPLVNEYLSNLDGDGHLLVMSAVPVVYRDFSFSESVFDQTPWEEELTDDLKDHWRSKEHQGERARLIHRLLENAQRRRSINPDSKTVILSGDVHLGCIGVINDTARQCKIHQVVSSGIVHPAPSRLQWIGIMAVTNDRCEYLDEGRNIRISMLTPFSSDKYIRQRNYVTLELGSDKKLWVNWESEGKDKPSYPIE